jgi:hypothetical protein
MQRLGYSVSENNGCALFYFGPVVENVDQFVEIGLCG